MSLDTIYEIGLKGKNAVTGTDDDATHFFIDNIGQLYELGEALQKLDYSEYLKTLTNAVVMSWDGLNNIVYICDGILGFIYNPFAKSLGRCQPNISGIDSQGAVLYVAAPATIDDPPFEICTDVYNFGTNTNKTITTVEVGADLASNIYVAIDYKRSIAGSWYRTAWIQVPSKGIVNTEVFGREFRFRVKTDNYEWFTLSYINIVGTKHNS
jgi:hypothetical protein